MEGITYLASPYSHPDPEVRQDRFERAVVAAGKLMRRGRTVFCPIAHSHDIGIYLGEESSFEFWMRQDLPILRHCAELVVLMLPGWRDSRGVRREIDTAYAIGIPVSNVLPGEL